MYLTHPLHSDKCNVKVQDLRFSQQSYWGSSVLQCNTVMWPVLGNSENYPPKKKMHCYIPGDLNLQSRGQFLSNAPSHPICLKTAMLVWRFFMLHPLALLIIVVLECTRVWSFVELTYRKKKKEVLGEKHVPVLLCLPQVSHRLDWDWAWTSTVTDQWLNTWALPRPSEILNSSKQFMIIYLLPHRKYSTSKLKTPVGFCVFQANHCPFTMAPYKHIHIYILWHNAEVSYVQADGTYTKHCALNGQKLNNK